MHPTPPETDRLWFREMVLEDLEDLFAMYSDEHARKYFPRMQTRDAVQDWIDWNINNYAHQGLGHLGLGHWVLVSKTTGQFVGECGITYQDIEGEQLIEIGYRISPLHRGQGYAFEAAKAVLKYSFETSDQPLICSIVEPGNDASICVSKKLHQEQKQIFYQETLPLLMFYTQRSQFDSMA